MLLTIYHCYRISLLLTCVFFRAVYSRSSSNSSSSSSGTATEGSIARGSGGVDGVEDITDKVQMLVYRLVTEKEVTVSTAVC